MKGNLNDELRDYSRQISRMKVLTRDEEVALFKRLKAGDETARQEIVEANLRFVVKIALQYTGRGVALADLVQEGNIGLLDVINKFDYRRGYRFSTYAAFWIRQSIQLSLRKSSNLIRLPIRKSRMLGHLTEAVNTFTNAHGRQPTTRELALMLKTDEKKLEDLLQVKDAVLSLDGEPENDNVELLKGLRDDKSPSPFDNAAEQQQHRLVAEAMRELSDREQQVLKLRYGFSTGQSLSLRSTSKVVGMSQEGVRRIERNALKKLRRPQMRERIAGLI